MELLSKYVEFKNGKKRPDAKGFIPVYGGNGILDYTNESNMENGVVVGRVGVYCGSVFLVKGKCWVSDNAIKAICNENMDLTYLYYLLLSLHLNKRQIGTSQPLLTQNILNNIEVDVPSLSVQRNIANILATIDEKIYVNNEINNNLLEQANALFENTICMSKGISFEKLGVLADVKGGKRLPKGVNLITIPNMHPYIRVRDLNDTIFASLNTEYEYVDDETQRGISRYIVSTGDVLLSIVGTIGLTAIVDYTLNQANLTENCVKLTNLNTITPEYLLLFLRSQKGKEAISQGTVGAVQPKLPIKNIQAISVPLLPHDEMTSLCKKLTALFAHISANVIEVKLLTEMRETLLPKLMSGELDVSNIQI